MPTDRHHAAHRSPALLCALGLASLALVFAGCSNDGDTKKSDGASATTTGSTTGSTTDSDTAASSGKGSATSREPAAKSDSKDAPSKKGKSRITIGAHPSVGAKPGKTKGIPASASPFVGVSTRAVSTDQARRAGPRAGTAGKWHLSMGESSYTLYSPDRAVLTGSLKKNGNRLVLARLSGRKGREAAACGGTKGTYRWSASGRRLTFAKIDDRCGVRSLLSGGEWTNLSRR